MARTAPGEDCSHSPLLLRLTREEQLAFWTALNEAPILTDAQRRLGKLMRSGTQTTASPALTIPPEVM
jgi:hypothetical protein